MPLLDIEIIDPDTGQYQQTLRFVRNNENIMFNGQEYIAGGFDLTVKHGVNEQSSLELTVNDYSQALQAQMQAYGGGVGFNTVFQIVDSSALDLPAEITEYFEVTTASASEYMATFVLSAPNALANSFPKRRQRKDFCNWRFKDPETCGYVGPETSCDLTLQGDKGCAAKTAPGWKPITFGAYPGINSNGFRYA